MPRFVWVPALLLAFSATAAGADQWEKTYPVHGRPELHAETKDGAVHIDSWDRSEVGVRVITERWQIGVGGGGRVQIEQHQDGNRIDVRVLVPHQWVSFGFSMRSIRVEIHVPRESDLDIKTGDGSVALESVAGHIVLDSGDGRISADHVRGDLSLSSGDGDIAANDFDGRLRAHTGDGRVRIDGRFDDLDLSSGDGSVAATARRGSQVRESWNLETGDGPVRLTLPEGLDADLDARTNDGRITLDFPVTVSSSYSHRELHGKLNHGGNTIRIRTGDGSIHLASQS